jgi:hypothetical protein
MNNIVTFETAQLLKEAGFPQPEFETGQFWYNEFGALSFIGRKEVSESDGHTYFFCMSVDTGRMEKIRPVADGAYFAPTATDILSTFADYELQILALTDTQDFVEMILDVEELAKIWIGSVRR